MDEEERMSLVSAIDRLHARVSRSVMIQKFADFTRAVLAVGFFAPGLHKLMGIPFTTLPLDNPIGSFFNALYQTGFYYRFIGAAQVLAAVLVLFRRTSRIGALLFLAITFNVFVVTISIPFGTGTPIITGLMFLASLFLVSLNYDKLKPLLTFASGHQVTSSNIDHPSSVVSRIGYWTFAVAGIILMCELRGLTPHDLKIRRVALLVSMLGGLVMAGGFVSDIVKSPLRRDSEERLEEC